MVRKNTLFNVAAGTAGWGIFIARRLHLFMTLLAASMANGLQRIQLGVLEIFIVAGFTALLLARHIGAFLAIGGHGVVALLTLDLLLMFPVGEFGRLLGLRGLYGELFRPVAGGSKGHHARGHGQAEKDGGNDRTLDGMFQHLFFPR